MGNSDSVIPSEVRDLIEESQKIGGWVTKLGDHSSNARPEVVEKVRQDYEARLGKVNGQLAEHRASLVETLETRRSEVEALRKDRDEHAAELEEARLRHAVGEFTDSQWGKRKKDIEQTLDDLDELLEHEDATVAELAEIITSIGATGPQLVVDDQPEASQPALVEDEPASTAEAMDDAETETTDDAPVELATEDTAEEPPAEVVAEDAAEEIASEAPVEEAEAEEPQAEEPAASAVDSTEADEGGEYLDELEFLESLSLGDSDRFDAVSAMLDDEDGKNASD